MLSRRVQLNHYKRITNPTRPNVVKNMFSQDSSKRFRWKVSKQKTLFNMLTPDLSKSCVLTMFTQNPSRKILRASAKSQYQHSRLTSWRKYAKKSLHNISTQIHVCISYQQNLAPQISWPNLSMNTVAQRRSTLCGVQSENQ